MSKLILNLWLLVILVCVPIIQSQRQAQTNDPCKAETTCSECIKIESCAWCMKHDFQFQPRCFEVSQASLVDCPEQEIYYPVNNVQTIRNLELTRRSHGLASSNITQIAPQQVKLALRATHKQSIKFSYSRAEDYPVDLYYLVDLSKSTDDKDKLVRLAEHLALALQNVTSDFRLGFGTFVNKALTPNYTINSLESCNDCAEFYGYRNIMRLSKDINQFISKLNNTVDRSKKCCNFFDNVDSPGEGIDAIMQALDCRSHIQWRVNARRLLVFSTDTGFHSVEAGRPDGVITPNDGFCHLDYRGFTYSKFQNYPTISQINTKARQTAINLIFAVTTNVFDVFQQLSNHVEGSSCAIVSDDFSNVVGLVIDEYNKISSSIEMKDNAYGDVQISYFTACLGGGQLMNKHKCVGLRVGDVVEFKAEFLLNRCPSDPRDWKQEIQIYPIGVIDRLTIDLDLLCECPCDNEYIPESEMCFGSGTYRCGICDCDLQYFGRQCECSTTYGIDSNGGCRATNDTLVDCNGRGSCVCDVCECDKRVDPNERIHGKYCECDNFSCDRHNGVVCSGSANGICECGVCRCFDGWTGNACECRSSTDTCKRNGVQDICSGHGDCVCGECKCHATEDGRYSGKYCEKCPTCASRCNEFKDCVQCKIYQTGPLNGEECNARCINFTPSEVEVINEQEDEYVCDFYDEDDCRFKFVYSENELNVATVRAQKERKCPSKSLFL